MIYLHHAILALNPAIATLRQDVAYDKDENIVEYDLAAAEAKLVEMQAAAAAAEEATAAAKQTGIAKLAKLGLTDAEIKALTGN